MPRKPQGRTPKYCHHKGRDLAYVTIDGREIYLGKYGSPESRDRFDAEINKWRRRHDQAALRSTTVGQLCLAFIKHAETFYRDKEGQPTGEADNFRQSLRQLLKSFRNVACTEFGPRRLQELQEQLAQTHVRTQVNKHVSRIKSVFRWGVAQEMVPVEAVTALECVRGLQAGRSSTREPEPVLPVPDADLAATLDEVTPNLAAMTQNMSWTNLYPVPEQPWHSPAVAAELSALNGRINELIEERRKHDAHVRRLEEMPLEELGKKSLSGDVRRRQTPAPGSDSTNCAKIPPSMQFTGRTICGGWSI
jgi:hypothetical protein